MSLGNWITSYFFRRKNKPDGKQTSKRHQDRTFSGKDEQIHKLESELEKRQNTIEEIEKLLLAQKKIEFIGNQIHIQKQESIEKLKNEIAEISRKHQEVIKKYEESIHELNSEITAANNKYQEEKNKLEKEQDIAASLERELEDERRTNSDYRKEIEAYEESVRKLNSEIAEINSRYQEAIEKLDKVADNAVTLEMLILDLDKELGLFKIIEKNKRIEILEAPIEI